MNLKTVLNSIPTQFRMRCDYDLFGTTFVSEETSPSMIVYSSTTPVEDEWYETGSSDPDLMDVGDLIDYDPWPLWDPFDDHFDSRFDYELDLDAEDDYGYYPRYGSRFHDDEGPLDDWYEPYGFDDYEPEDDIESIWRTYERDRAAVNDAFTEESREPSKDLDAKLQTLRHNEQHQIRKDHHAARRQATQRAKKRKVAQSELAKKREFNQARQEAHSLDPYRGTYYWHRFNHLNNWAELTPEKDARIERKLKAASERLKRDALRREDLRWHIKMAAQDLYA